MSSIVISLFSLLAVFFFYHKYWVNSPEKLAEREINQLVKSVARLIDLPADELPVVATVKNTDELKEQTFFSNAKIGYKILIYEKNKKAIMYNPESDKIVEVSHIGVLSN